MPINFLNQSLYLIFNQGRREKFDLYCLDKNSLGIIDSRGPIKKISLNDFLTTPL